MLHLYLLRHGKSDWKAGDWDGSDHSRPLAPRGKRAARLVGRVLTALGEAPQRVITSTARRARDTVALAAEAGDWDCPVEETDRLYLSSTAEVLAAVRDVAVREDVAVRKSASGESRWLLAGHQPVWSGLVTELTRTSEGSGSRVRMPTAALARVDLEGDPTVGGWEDVRPGGGELRWLVTPKLLEPLIERLGSD